MLLSIRQANVRKNKHDLICFDHKIRTLIVRILPTFTQETRNDSHCKINAMTCVVLTFSMDIDI